ncbi:hypothetical protein cce_1883 [Crocosphaera subtropica ATCC 51142]|uniref:Uncharacterized protein n=1 Tax=Crocosphaera subtropica (strain ATCC 51142 / BH68) TaxID=43989 RepID=B1X0E4_CROS5|nr:CopG family transcriptional regulator [Crocosphaera subtropica]ACB51233.1 hypothetical protein cce_1883 [Crocosphaera subtropica ATCC 51142]
MAKELTTTRFNVQLDDDYNDKLIELAERMGNTRATVARLIICKVIDLLHDGKEFKEGLPNLSTTGRTVIHHAKGINIGEGKMEFLLTKQFEVEQSVHNALAHSIRKQEEMELELKEIRRLLESSSNGKPPENKK